MGHFRIVRPNTFALEVKDPCEVSFQYPQFFSMVVMVGCDMAVGWMDWKIGQLYDSPSLLLFSAFIISPLQVSFLDSLQALPLKIEGNYYVKFEEKK